MTDRATSMSLLRLLAAVAWADGTVQQEEERFVLDLAEEFGVPMSDRREIEGLLLQPLGREEFERYAADLEQRVRDPEIRLELVDRVSMLAHSDLRSSPEETAYLDRLRDVLQVEGRSGVFSRLTGLLSGRPGGLGSAGQALQDRLSRIMQGAFGSGAEADSHQASLDPARKVRLALFGSLLDRVMRVDRTVSPQEEARLRDLLQERFELSSPEIDAVLRLVAGRRIQGDDRQRLCAEYNRISDLQQRRRLLAALFEMAKADGRVSPEEEREIRLISNYLWIEPQDFAAVRHRALPPPSGGPGRAEGDRPNGESRSGRDKEAI